MRARKLHVRLAFALVVSALAFSASAWAKGGNIFDASADLARERPYGPADVLRGWDRFADVWFMLDMAVVLVLSVVLGGIIAYHPLARSKATSLAELEQPKTFLMYAMVGAMLGIIVPHYPVMGMVIFGIGSLLRFRTNVGEAKDTGRVILAVVVGVAAGLKLIPVAVVATAFGWVIIWYLEKQDFGRMQVKGLSTEMIPRAAEAYRLLLVTSGCRILGEKKKFDKGLVSFVFTAPRRLDREGLERQFHVAIPVELRGSVDWDIA